MIKLALCDLDNTLMPAGAPCASRRTIAAIHRMLDAGLHFGPVSGRVPAAMRWMFGGDEACSRTGAFVNGQLVYVDGQLVHEELLPGEEPTAYEVLDLGLDMYGSYARVAACPTVEPDHFYDWWVDTSGLRVTADGEEERAVTPATPARLAALEAEERMLAYA